jgi:integrase/recombinase XerD
MMARHTEDDGTRLFDRNGQRKYLCRAEGQRFLRAAAAADEATRLFCQLLAYTGCRISEGLALIPAQLDAEAQRVIFRTLKRRRRVFRAVPVPAALMRDLQLLARGRQAGERLWPWCRQTGWRRVKSVMAEARIRGPQAMPKGLRHQFGMTAADRKVPPNLIQRWMGHASPGTTATYLDAVGAEERGFARRMW